MFHFKWVDLCFGTIVHSCSSSHTSLIQMHICVYFCQEYPLSTGNLLTQLYNSMHQSIIKYLISMLDRIGNVNKWENNWKDKFREQPSDLGGGRDITRKKVCFRHSPETKEVCFCCLWLIIYIQK